MAGSPPPRPPLLFQVFRVVSICLGNPPTTFSWEYYDKDKNYHKIGPISPAKFYQEHVKPLFDMESKVCLVNDPRPRNKYNQLYTVEYLGNMVGGRKTLYNNQPVELLKKMAAASIQDGEAVWFGCDVGKCFNSKLGINDLKIYNHELMFGVSVKNLKKDERLIFGDSMMTHAMVITAFSKKEEPDEGYEKWRVENSWGEDRGNKGYLLMTDAWFSEFVWTVHDPVSSWKVNQAGKDGFTLLGFCFLLRRIPVGGDLLVARGRHPPSRNRSFLIKYIGRHGVTSPILGKTLTAPGSIRTICPAQPLQLIPPGALEIQCLLQWIHLQAESRGGDPAGSRNFEGLFGKDGSEGGKKEGENARKEERRGGVSKSLGELSNPGPCEDPAAEPQNVHICLKPSQQTLQKELLLNKTVGACLPTSPRKVTWPMDKWTAIF
ncbi:bleomycin hydrolase [Crotalus adamanteus]|uniref:Bleomycin hydrolase n=1 Tax=Crotalus adamanteus TaxID=8729 RepID=A0AAW1CIN2_CROAD